MKSSSRILVATLFAALGAPLPAAARECARAGEHLVIARRAQQVHDWPRAIAEYRQSYELDGNPSTLVLLARVYTETGALADALDLYRGYLEQVPSGSRTFDVEAEIVRLSNALLNRRLPIFDDSDLYSFGALPLVD